MRIERVDDKTVRCFLTNEELDEYEVDYKDFIMRSEKAKELVHDIVEQATEEVGYKPPQFAFDLQIMMVPDQGLLLTFSEQDPVDNLDKKTGEHLVECLKEMQRILKEGKGKKSVTGEKPAETSGEKTGAEKADEPPAQVEISLFAFSGLNAVIEYARVLPANLRVGSALYEMNGIYYLYMHKGAASYERYSRACVQALEFGSLYSAEQKDVTYIERYADCLIAEKALKKLRLN